MNEIDSTQALILVVDDDRWIRRAVARLLRTAGLRVETFASGIQLLQRSMPEQPCCVVLDLRMPEIDGLETLAALDRTDRRPPVIFITAQGDVASSVAAMKAGAVEFLEKPFEDDDLLQAIEGALVQDRQWLHGQARLEQARLRLGSLTPREQEILPFLVEGFSNKVTASSLGITEKTVKVHRARVFEKAGASSLPDLVRLAALLGIHGIDRPAPGHGAIRQNSQQAER